MKIVDWRQLPADQVAPLYNDQSRAWNGVLGWDLSASWAVVERARAAGALPGLVCLDRRERIVGWTFFMRQDDVVQIGALAGRGAGPVRELLECVLDAPESAGARELTCLLYPARPNALSALTRRRFEIDRLRYLSRPVVADDLPIPLPEELTARRWRGDQDALGCIRVLARAYGRDGAARNIAPNGTLEEWAHHLGQILRTPACGTMLPRASFVVEERRDGAIAGFVVTTTVGADTAHIAQLAVDPQWRRRGVGRALVHHTAKAASAEGLARLTLLLQDDNPAPVGLFTGAGFEEAGQFVFASRSMPVRRQVALRRAA